MKTIRISRANFPENGMFSWLNYFRWVLSKKYNVIVDGKNPDILFYTCFYNDGTNIDHYTKELNRLENQYSPNVKRVFITGELFHESSYRQIISQGENYYALGFSHIDHPQYLRFPTYVLDTWVLYDESRIFDEPFNWLIKPKNVDEIFSQYKRFCSVVQASNNPDRGRMFDLLQQHKPIKSSGPWRTTVPENERPEKGLYLQNEYIGRIDGLTYRSKINFFKDCKFNLAFQYTNTPTLTQEKIVHAMAANSIPIFYGNDRVHEEFNPDSFLNVHSYNSFEEAFERIREIDTDDNLCKKILAQPWCHDNKLPIYYNPDRLLEFFERMIG